MSSLYWYHYGYYSVCSSLFTRHPLHSWLILWVVYYCIALHCLVQFPSSMTMNVWRLRGVGDLPSRQSCRDKYLLWCWPWFSCLGWFFSCSKRLLHLRWSFPFWWCFLPFRWSSSCLWEVWTARHIHIVNQPLRKILVKCHFFIMCPCYQGECSLRNNFFNSPMVFNQASHESYMIHCVNNASFDIPFLHLHWRSSSDSTQDKNKINK